MGKPSAGILTEKNDAATKKDLNELSEVVEEKSYASEDDNEVHSTAPTPEKRLTIKAKLTDRLRD